MAPGNTARGDFSPHFSPGTFTSCPDSPLLPKVLSLPTDQGFDGSEKGQRTPEKYCNSKARQHSGISQFLMHSLKPGLPIPTRYSRPPSLHVCTAVLKSSSAMYPCKLFHCLPRHPTTYAFLLHTPCLSVDVCTFLHLINQTLTKTKGVFSIFLMLVEGTIVFAPLLESPLGIYMYPSTFKDKKPNPVAFIKTK